MDRSVRRDIEKRYRKVMERYNGKADEVGCYVCEQCGKVTKVRQVDKGIAPGGIECPYCNGQANLEVDIYPNIPVTYEWYRPTIEETLAFAETRLFTMNFILSGGLVRRKVSEELS